MARRVMVEIIGDASSLQRAFGRAGRSATGFNSVIGGATAGLRHLAGAMGVTVGIAGLAYGMKSSIAAASKFAGSMEMLATQTGATQGEVKRMTAAVKQMSVSVGTGPQMLAQGLYHVESAGLRGAKALKLLETAAKGAAVGHADLEAVTNALVAAQASGIRGVQNMDQAMGSLNAIVGAGNMYMQDLADAMKSGILPTAKSFGLTITDVGAALAVMTQAGVPAVDAATRLRMTFSLLGAPTKGADKALRDIGLTGVELGDTLRNKGLIPALQLLKTHLEASGLSATEQSMVISRAFGGGRMSSSLLTLLGNLDVMRGKFQQIQEGAGSFGKAWEQTQETGEFAIKKFNAALELTKITIGAVLLPALTPLLNSMSQWLSVSENQERVQRTVTSAVNGFKSAVSTTVGVVKELYDAADRVADKLGGWKSTLELAAGAWVGFRAAAVVTNAVVLASSVAAALGVESAWRAALISTGWGALAVAAGMAAAYVITHWDKVKGWFESFGAWIQREFKIVWLSLQAGALRAYLNILEPFSHLPKGMGKWARDAKDEANKELKQLKIDIDWQKNGAAAGGVYADAFATAATPKVRAALAGVSGGPGSSQDRLPSQQGQSATSNLSQTMNKAQLMQLWVQAGGAKEMAATMAAIALAESGGRTRALNTKAPDYSAGLWQINYFGKMRAGRTAAFGSPEDVMQDPLKNAAAAVKILASQGLAAWSTYTSGAYKKFVDGGTTAVQAAAADTTTGAALPEVKTAAQKAAAARKKAAALLKGFIDGLNKNVQDWADEFANDKTAGASLKTLRYDLLREQQNIRNGIAKVDVRLKTASAADRPKLEAEHDHLVQEQKKVGAQLVANAKAQAALARKTAAALAAGRVDSSFQQAESQIAAMETLASYEIPGLTLDFTKQIGSIITKQSASVENGIAKLRAMGFKDADEPLQRLLSDLSQLKAQRQQLLENAVKRAQDEYAGALDRFRTAFQSLASIASGAFEEQTQEFIRSALGPKFFQGAQSPLEQKLADMQREDQLQSLQKALVQAQKQLDLDLLQEDVTQDQIDTDREAIYQAQRAIDEDQLAQQASSERARADSDYAAAVTKWENDRKAQGEALTATFANLQAGIEAGTSSVDGFRAIISEYGIPWTAALAAAFTMTKDSILGSDGLNKSVTRLQDAFEALADWLEKQTGVEVPSPQSATVPSPSVLNTSPGLILGKYTATVGGVTIPKEWLGLAAGGIVRGPTFALIGERGPEAVVPLDRMGGTPTVVHFHFDRYMGSRDELVREMSSEFNRYLRRNGVQIGGAS